jgi:hypothetical protein
MWTGAPMATGDAVCDGSLQLASHLDRKTRRLDGTIKHKGPNLIKAGLWQELMEVNEKYGDLATWEMKSLTVGDSRVMLGVLAMAVGLEDFEWQTCNNLRHPRGTKPHRAPATIQLLDDPATISRFGLNDRGPTSQPLQESTLEDVLDDSLRRGGSSLEDVIEFDQQLIAKAKGLEEIPLGESQGNEVSSQANDLELVTISSDHIIQPEDNLPSFADAKATSTSFLKSVIRKLSQDDQGVSTKTVDLTQRKSRSTTRKYSLGVPSKTGVSNLKSMLSNNLLKRKTTRSKSKKKKFKRVQAEDEDDDIEDEEEDVENSTRGSAEQKPPLTARSIIQQVGLWLSKFCPFDS